MDGSRRCVQPHISSLRHILGAEFSQVFTHIHWKTLPSPGMKRAVLLWQLLASVSDTQPRMNFLGLHEPIASHTFQLVPRICWDRTAETRDWFVSHCPLNFQCWKKQDFPWGKCIISMHSGQSFFTSRYYLSYYMTGGKTVHCHVRRCTALSVLQSL